MKHRHNVEHWQMQQLRRRQSRFAIALRPSDEGLCVRFANITDKQHRNSNTVIRC